MNKKDLITILGLLVIVLPFIGIPHSFLTVIFVLIGFSIIFVARSGSQKKKANTQ